jgi:lipopolysaccharide heptosyltransferase II
MAEAFHTVPFQHRIRRILLRMIAFTPRRPVRTRSSRPRILLIRPDHLGDMLLTTPALAALRAALPGHEIHVLAGPWSASVLANADYADQVITLPFPGFNRGPKEGITGPYRALLRASRQIRRIGYQSAVILRPDHWWGAALAQMAGIPERIGYDLPDVKPFLTHAIQPQHQHAVLQSMKLVERWTGPIPEDRIRLSFRIEDAARQYIETYLREWGVPPDRRLICLHPGSGTWVKRWTGEDWAMAADTLIDQLDAAIIITGSDKELPLARAIAGHMRYEPCIMSGDTQIPQLAALFARSSAVLGPDSGPLHLAAAVDTPTVALFGPADPVTFAPWGPADHHIVLTSSIGCRPCMVLDWGGDAPENHPCVRDITVGDVLEAARRVVQP